MPRLYSTPGGATVVTPESGTAVVSALWDARGRALAAHDVSALGTFETGSALAVDAARCGCGTGDPFGRIRSVTAAVPRFSRFPAHFLAEVSTTLGTDEWLALLVVTRASSDQPWRIAFAGGFIPASPFVIPQVDAGGYLPAIDPQLRAVAALQPAALATYWQQWKDDGTSSGVTRQSIWVPGVMTDGFGRVAAGAGQQGEVNRENGLVGRYRYQADPRGTTYVYPLQPKELLVCAPVLRQITWTDPIPSRTVSQPPSRDNWGPDLAPGEYRAVMQDDIASPCIVVDLEGAGIAKNDVVGIDPEPAAAVGVGVK